jgi:hypothetical protein
MTLSLRTEAHAGNKGHGRIFFIREWNGLIKFADRNPQ